MRIELKPGQAREFNGLRIINTSQKYSAFLLLEPVHYIQEMKRHIKRESDEPKEEEHY